MSKQRYKQMISVGIIAVVIAVASRSAFTYVGWKRLAPKGIPEILGPSEWGFGKQPITVIGCSPGRPGVVATIGYIEKFGFIGVHLPP